MTTTTCIDCGAKLVADVQFISKDYVGFVSAPCVCGSKRSGCSTMTTRTQVEHDSWSFV